jgi:pSer/pThr/pTyr-binding forkhead associated (FHA) protein
LVNRNRPCLVVERRCVILMEGANVVGRAPAAAIVIDVRGGSRQHARILISDRSATLEDLGSKNGTILNGPRGPAITDPRSASRRP